MAQNGLIPEHDEVQTLARESIDAAVGSSAFMIAKVDTWTSNIVENCLKVRAPAGLGAPPARARAGSPPAPRGRTSARGAPAAAALTAGAARAHLARSGSRTSRSPSSTW